MEKYVVVQGGCCYKKSYLFPCIVEKINKEILIFGYNGIDKREFHYPENSILINNVDIDNILIYSKAFFLVKRVINTLLVTKMTVIN